MKLRKGSRVATGFGPGVVSDMETYAGECLVRLDRGSVFDMTHGRWMPQAEVTVTGFDGEAMVWWAGRMRPASETV